MEISQERKELEDEIYGNLHEIKNTLEDTIKRIELARNRMKPATKGSAMIVPEDKVLDQDLKQIINGLRDAETDMAARMRDYENLLDLIEEEREAGENQ